MKIRTTFQHIAFAVMIIIGTVPTTVFANAIPVAPNIMLNPDVELADAANSPLNWTQNSWGNNSASLLYANTGYSGSHSLTTTIASRTDGDAKWVPDPVTVVSGQSYTYTDYYNASVGTELDVQFTDSTGAVTYAYLAQEPASATYQMATATVLVPANVTKLSVLHILAAVGTLNTDAFSLTTTTAPTPVTPPIPDPSGNLILNPSFETSTPSGSPASWSQGGYGNNTAQFNYATTGQSGSRSASVQVTNYVSGDAKWVADPVAVAPNNNYTYSDYYQSTVTSRVVVGFVDVNNVVTYYELPSAQASTSWSLYQQSFIVPAGTVKAAVYHLLAQNGSLSIDSVSLKAVPPVNISGIIPNASLEQASLSNSGQPYGWSSSKWGSNTAQFDYIVTDGHNSSRSAKVIVSNYVSGDAKWYFDPIDSLTVGQTYRFSAWYKTNTQPQVVASYVTSSGVTQYFSMPTPLVAATAATTWQQYNSSFSLPSGATHFSVFMLLSSNGWLQVDDYAITPYQPVGFNRALVSLTFDDGWQGTYIDGLPILNKYGFTSTQYIISGKINTGNGYMTSSQIRALKASGNEIASHTVSHYDLTSLSLSSIDYQLSQSKSTIQKLFGTDTAINFATPYGSYDAKVLTEVKKYYKSHRSTDSGYNSKDGFDAYNIRVQNVNQTTTASQVSEWTQKAIADKTWLVLVYHSIDLSGDAYATSPLNLDNELSLLKTSGVKVETVNQALDEITPQL